jgi:hypothetical protein
MFVSIFFFQQPLKPVFKAANRLQATENRIFIGDYHPVWVAPGVHWAF